MDPKLRISELVNMASSKDFPLSTPLDRYLQQLNDIFQIGINYAVEEDEEKAFVFLLRFISIAVEELPNHEIFSRIPMAERLSIDAKIIEAIVTAEYLKSNLRKRYERDFLLSQKCGPSALISNKCSPSMTDWNLLENQLSQLGPYVLCQEISFQPIVFEHILIPKDLPQTFLKNTTNEFRFAYLYGKLVRSSIIASHLVVANIEKVNTEKYERFVYETESDFPIIGCICMSLADVCKTNFFKRCQLSEMLCIICPDNSARVLHLVNMSPSTSYHQKLNNARDTNNTNCRHLNIVDTISSVVVNPNSIANSTSCNNLTEDKFKIEQTQQ